MTIKIKCPYCHYEQQCSRNAPAFWEGPTIALCNNDAGNCNKYFAIRFRPDTVVLTSKLSKTMR